MSLKTWSPAAFTWSQNSCHASRSDSSLGLSPKAMSSLPGLARDAEALAVGLDLTVELVGVDAERVERVLEPAVAVRRVRRHPLPHRVVESVGEVELGSLVELPDGASRVGGEVLVHHVLDPGIGGEGLL